MRFLRPWWLVLYCLLVYMFFFRSSAIDYQGTIEVKKWESFSSLVTTHFSGIEKYALKRRLRSHAENLSPLQPGLYTFTGSLTREAFFKKLSQGPQSEYQSVTILEWWSSYDIDDALARKWYIKKGEYLTYVTSGWFIKEASLKYPFLGWTARGELKPLITLEGFLYPDTYSIDRKKNFVSQLVSLQLQQFGKVVRSVYEDQIKTYNATISTMGWNNLSLNWYKILILATIIEKEERADKNRPIIAGIFLNRLAGNMRIDADITLCYGLHQGYDSCPPSVIVQHLKDDSNPYNTRAVPWLPPTPIANPQLSSIQAILQPKFSQDLFYLHDSKGRIYTAKTNAEHELNKSKYLP